MQADITKKSVIAENRDGKPRQWRLWARQIGALLSLELPKTLLSRRAALLYLLAGAPLLLLALLCVRPLRLDASDTGVLLNNANTFYAQIYVWFLLRTVIFFGCAWLFMSLFRGEIIDRSLHYYFLTPVRREVLLVGKYLSGLLAAWAVFGVMTLIAQLLFYTALGPAVRSAYFANGPGLRQALTYLTITLLACMGYGAVFVLVGLVFRNPVIPALLAYGWEIINFLLPPLLKKISVVHYLNSLAPVPVTEGPFAITAEPTPVIWAVLGLILFTVVVLALAGRRARRLEISYGNE